MDTFRNLALGSGLAAGLLCGSALAAQAPDSLRVSLSRLEGHQQMIGHRLNVDPGAVAKAMEETPVKLPSPLPDGATVGFDLTGVFVLVDRATQASAFLTVDANTNRDLTDDAAVEVKSAGGDGTVVVRVRRVYPGSPPREVWLPYRFQYELGANRQGQPEPRVFMTPAYRVEGKVRVGGTEYVLAVRDYTLSGRFDRNNLEKGGVLSLRQADDPEESAASLFGYELIALGGQFYTVRDGAVDGSWIELTRADHVMAAIGRVVPDFTLTDSAGRSFQLREYRGRYLLLDFWPSSCGPCVREFANIKKTLERHAHQPLSVVGINLDPEKTLGVARKIIEDQAPPWRQVVPGAGSFMPIYQVLGRLPEKRMVFPLYVVINPDGVVGYATNQYAKMQRFLEQAFAPATARTEALFVPLAADPRSPLGEPRPVDFTSLALKALLADPKAPSAADLPKDARVGRIPTGVLLAVRPGDTSTRLWVRVDEDGDSNLAEHKEVEIPVLDQAPARLDDLPALTTVLSFGGGQKAYARFRFGALATPEGPQVFYVGYKRSTSGTFVRGGVEYRISISDPAFDLVFTSEDVATPGFLTLEERHALGWRTLASGVTDLPIAGHHYRVRHVEDDGELIVIERQTSGQDGTGRRDPSGRQGPLRDSPG